MEVVKLNRIKAVLAETDSRENGWRKNLAKTPQQSLNDVPIIQPDMKTLAEKAEILNVNIQELRVNT